jgi:CheY-like chemotaxis protein
MLYKNILLIDDDYEDGEVFIEAINSLNKNILCQSETNPIKALENLKSSKNLPDLIFLDYNMPVLNGDEFIKKMREVVQLRQIPIILYSTYSTDAAEQLSITQMTDRYITKPSTFVELTSVLKSILDV